MEDQTQNEALRRALASPLRLEILGLFTAAAELSIADMAQMMGRPATSLYHHISIFEKLGVLRESGTRPKGKRHEKLYAATGERVELALDQKSESAKEQLKKVMRSAFRMADKDFATALDEAELITEGEERNLLAYRVHLRCDAETLAKVNAHLDALSELLSGDKVAQSDPAPTDKFLSITLALLPLPGRQANLESTP